MVVTDEEKESIKKYVYGDTASFKGMLLECLKNDDVQKDIFLAGIKGAFLKSYGFLAAILLTVWIGNSLPSVQQIVSFFNTV